MISSICKERDFHTDWFHYWMKEMAIEPRVHPYYWSIAAILENINQKLVLKSNPRVLGIFDHGYDLGVVLNKRGIYHELITNSSKLDDSSHVICQKFSDFDFTRKYDFIWSIGVLNKLGSIENTIQAIDNLLECLTESGTAIFILDYNIKDNEHTVDNNPEFVLFRKKDLQILESKVDSINYNLLFPELFTSSSFYDTAYYDPKNTETFRLKEFRIRSKNGAFTVAPVSIVIERKSLPTKNRSIFSSKQELVEQKPLFFNHIPKTAGTTTIDLISKNFDPSEVLTTASIESILTTYPSTPRKYKFIFGHLFNNITTLFPQRFESYTVLRDPVTRIISHYEHMRRGELNDEWFKDSNGKIFDIEVILEDNPEHLINWYIKHLGQEVDLTSIYELHKHDINLIKNIHEANNVTDANKMTEYGFRRAIEVSFRTLESMVCIGIQERLQESMFLLAYKRGWKPEIISKQLRKSENKSEYSSETLEFIRQKSQLDYEVYNYGLNKFEIDYTSMKEDLKKKYYKLSMRKLDEIAQVYQLLSRHYQKNS